MNNLRTTQEPDLNLKARRQASKPDVYLLMERNRMQMTRERLRETGCGESIYTNKDRVVVTVTQVSKNRVQLCATLEAEPK